MRGTSYYVLAAALTLAAPAALGQTAAPGATPAPAAGTTTGPGTGTGTGTGTTSAPLPGDLDLPLTQPVLTTPVTPTPPPVPTPDDGDEDDPRDEPPPVIYGEEIDSENDTIFYVIDQSGSMDWDTQSYTDVDGSTRRGTRMERAKTELMRSILGLSSNFRFNIISYDCATRRWRSEMVEANDANKQAALGWVRAIEADGATGTGPAVALALSDRENMSVVLLTDGAPNCGVWEFSTDDWLNDAIITEAHRRVINDANAQRATINVFGIAASGLYRRFCQNVAADSGGSYFDVP